MAGDRILISGPGSIGLLAGQFAMAMGAEVHLSGDHRAALELAKNLGISGAWLPDELALLPFDQFDSAIDTSSDSHVPSDLINRVSPGGRVVYLGLSPNPSFLDSRSLVLKDVTAVGVLSGTPATAETITLMSQGLIQTAPLLSAVVSLEDLADVLDGNRPADSGPGPKIQVDPRL